MNELELPPGFIRKFQTQERPSFDQVAGRVEGIVCQSCIAHPESVFRAPGFEIEGGKPCEHWRFRLVADMALEGGNMLLNVHQTLSMGFNGVPYGVRADQRLPCDARKAGSVENLERYRGEIPVI